ncbi:mannose-1-phosphate guanylyltransferase/mannose-6-phosphate isomerase (plasmid) [Segnochrobactraceae bacterium EtOH-i3]
MIIPVILSGGSGTRLWPLSRSNFPKQFHALKGNDSLLVETLRRLSGKNIFSDPIIIGSYQHRFVLAEQTRATGFEKSTIILEPISRNTAPTAAVAAILALEKNDDPILLLSPADHVILDRAEFLRSVDIAAKAAVIDGGKFVLFGISPDYPATGYGYIRQGRPISNLEGAYIVDGFVEKPDLATAKVLFSDGYHTWNSGIFIMPAKILLAEMERLAPAVLAAARKAVEGAIRDPDFIRLDEVAYTASPSISIDYALMEKTSISTVVPSSFGWTDVGSWKTLWEISNKTPSGCVILGDVIDIGAIDCYIRSEGPTIAVAGVRNLVIVATSDAVLVIDREADQDVKNIVERLNAAGRLDKTESARKYK